MAQQPITELSTAPASTLPSTEKAVSYTHLDVYKRQIPGWLSFETATTSARTGRNPRTGETIEIPAGKRVKVSVGSKLKAAVK